jgi:predicted oxidoreductase
MHKVKLSDNLEISRFVHGMWKLAEWNLSQKELLKFIENVIELGINTFDHADFYGNYSCEQLFGNAISLNKSIRNKIKIVTKCGVKLMSDKFPERKIKYYDYTSNHIIQSVENSLKNLQVDHIDLLLLHRPAPFFNPEEVATAFSQLKKSGKVSNFGVSNFKIIQFEMLSKYMDEKLVTNQVEISPYCLEHFENGNMDYFLKENISPMAWSPLASGKILTPKDEKGEKIYQVITEIAEELNVNNVDQIVFNWLIKHPATIVPVLGTGKIEHVKSALKAVDFELNLEQWYQIYIAGLGKKLP